MKIEIKHQRTKSVPLASESTFGNEQDRQHAEDWERRKNEPLVPEWAKVIGESCLCGLSYIEPEVIAVCEVPFDGERVMLECPCCLKIWVEKR